MNKKINVLKENEDLAEIISGYKENIVLDEAYSKDLDFAKDFLEVAENDELPEVAQSSEIDKIVNLLQPRGLVESRKQINDDAKSAAMAIKKISEQFIKDENVKNILNSTVEKLSML